MAAIDNHEYVRLCAELASCLTVSISAARRKVELVAAKEGARDLSSRIEIALRLLKKATSLKEKGEDVSSKQFDQLLLVLSEKEENFMLED